MENICHPQRDLQEVFKNNFKFLKITVLAKVIKAFQTFPLMYFKSCFGESRSKPHVHILCFGGRNYFYPEIRVFFLHPVK